VKISCNRATAELAVSGLPDTPPLYSSLRASSRPATGETDPRPGRRKSSRISFSGMLNDVRELVQGHPIRHNFENEDVILESPLERQETREDLWRGRSRGRKDKSAITRLGEAFGIDMHEDGEDDEDPSWKELQPGKSWHLFLLFQSNSIYQVNITSPYLSLYPWTCLLPSTLIMGLYNTD
jgi:hypothetical protein